MSASMYVPKCPGCGEVTILLAPLNVPVNESLTLLTLPLGCSNCPWRGTWSDVIYIRL